MAIHESSPSGPASAKIQRNCPGYVASQFYPDVAYGTIKDGCRCENLEKMTYADETFDLVITQDVLEHVFHPEAAFAEIARTLKPGGAHVFTVPLYVGRATLVRAFEEDGAVRHLQPPDYHGNPISAEGSLVVREWGDDLPEVIRTACGLETEIFLVRDRRLGIDGKFLEVFVSRKVK
jgi:SAM-dependent methyltransferase